MGSPKVRVNCHVDQGKSIIRTLSKNKSPSASPSDRSHREAGVTTKRRFINGQYMDCGFTFGELRSDDDIDLDDNLITEEADRQGRIVVKLRRGHFANRKVEDHGERSFDPPEHVDAETTHNKVVHKHHVSHVLKHVPLRQSNMEPKAPHGYPRQWVRATGDGSKPIVFTLRYRSRALLALGIIDENAPVVASTETEDPTMSHRSRAQKNARNNVNDVPTISSLATENVVSSDRSLSKTLTPGPLLSCLMHTDADDDDDEDPPVKTRPMSSGSTEQNLNPGAQPTMSPTPNQGHSALSSIPSVSLTPRASPPPVVISLLSDDDEEDDQDREKQEQERTTFSLFSADDVRKKSALGVRKSHSNTVIDGRAESPNNNDGTSGGGDNGDGASDCQGEMVGPGYATPPRYGGSSLRPLSVGLTDQERKRAWSQVEQAEQELQEEETAAILASERREKRRQELMDAKRYFLDLD